MALRIHLILLFISTLLFTSSSKHPLKLTSSEIKYDEKAKSIKVNCRVFIDDFAPTIHSTLFFRIQKSDLTEDDKKKIEHYFQEKYRLFINNKRLHLKFEDYTVEQNIMLIEFSESYITLKKGDELYIENELLFEVFEYQQSNWMTFNMSPFLLNQSFESTFDDFSYSHKL